MYKKDEPMKHLKRILDYLRIKSIKSAISEQDSKEG